MTFLNLPAGARNFLAAAGLLCLLGSSTGFGQDQTVTPVVPAASPASTAGDAAAAASPAPDSASLLSPAATPAPAPFTQPAATPSIFPATVPAEPSLPGATQNKPVPAAPLPNALSELPETPGAAETGGQTPAGQGAAQLTAPAPGVPGAPLPDAGNARRFQYAFRLGISATYDDNIFLTRNGKVDDGFFVFTPSVTVGFGDIISKQANFIRLDYAPEAFVYANHSEDDNVQHLIRLEGEYRLPKLTIVASQDVQILDGADLAAVGSGAGTGGSVAPVSSQVNLDVNGRTRVNIYTTAVNLTYDLGEKLSSSGAASYSVQDYSTLLSSESLNGSLFLDYAVSPKLSFGGGVAGGYVYADSPSPDQSFIQVNGRAQYQVSGKVFVAGSAGVEYRMSDGSSDGRVSPVFELSATYAATDSTSLTLSGSRHVLPSAVLGGQDFETTAITASIQQRFLQRFFTSLTSGYENSHYVSELDGVQANRDDNYYFIQPSVSVQLREGLSLSAYYLHRQNFSSVGPADFADNQVGATVTLSF